MDKKVVGFVLFVALICWLAARNGGGDGAVESVSDHDASVDAPERERPDRDREGKEKLRVGREPASEPRIRMPVR
jgi:hypothetical protein